MALTRKSLSAMGLSAEQVDSIIEMHTETVDGIKAERDKYKADADRLGEVQSQLEAARGQIAGGDAYKAQYDALKTEFDQYKADVAARAAMAAKETAYRGLLAEVGVPEKRMGAVLRVADLGSIEMADDGVTIKDADRVREAIRTEWADFIGTVSTAGATVANPPQGGGGTGGMTREQIIAIRDPAARQAAIAENISLFTEPVGGR